jgi:broad specificity phosphatase PhoE
VSSQADALRLGQPRSAITRIADGDAAEPQRNRENWHDSPPLLARGARDGHGRSLGALWRFDQSCRRVAALMKSMTRDESTCRRLRLPARALVIIVILLVSGSGQACRAGLKVYFLRHAEAGHNVVDEWKSKPKDQWPAYVGNPNAFSPKGLKQIAACTKRLKKYHFDFIAASPTWRTRSTVAPYLRETCQVAELWPELLEFGSLDQQHDFNPLPPASTNLFRGDPIRLADSDQGIFSLCPDRQRLFRLGDTPAQKAADRWAVVQMDIELIRKRFGGSEASILLVSHGNIGSLLLEAFTEDKELFKVTLRNTSLWMVEEQPDGRFKLRLLNDRRVR